MDKLEYIPGDLAIVDDCIVKIITVNFNYGLNKVDSYNAIFASGDAHRYGIKKLKPIPLTPGILEKNGWKFYGQHEKIWWNDDESWISYNNITKTDINLRFYTESDFFLPCLKDKEISRNPIKYVHELQHLFFGLGINYEMEVQLWEQVQLQYH